ncbi:MAG: hypothetical protein A2W80_05600 [Candidatus Riflebacteria bacterium GWC2_50_8]|nr:MAG: hypothetical protein A2W80_05600 [Candidatus Riflebacteria bacterium GWC2_50_8]
MKSKSAALFLCVIAMVLAGGVLSAATISGLVTVTRDANRAIVSAVIETSTRDSSGAPVIYNIVMDENGQAIAQQYENNEVKIEGAVSGKDITADTWSRVKQAGGSEPAYREPDPEPEPVEEEVSEEEPSGDGDKEEPEEGSGETEEGSGETEEPEEE